MTKEEKLRIDAKVEYPFNSSVKARECFIDAVKSEVAREYWKESLKDEMKQNAIEFSSFLINQDTDTPKKIRDYMISELPSVFRRTFEVTN